MRIYTLGTSGRNETEFWRILQKYQIQAIVDVRRFPTSRLEHFKKENLSKLCKKNRVEYIYLGNELGGYRKEGYQQFTAGETFKKGIQILQKIAEEKTTCILCAERWVGRCHRRFITNELSKNGIEVIHILEEEKVWIPK